ncbi:Hypothetical protein EUBELI_00644 [Lachnospira eligens ATCC 27750]|uniref:Uncharacterized protein n=1 Tax=Lachnospira eligens (strain ATCC 27750 / DSM 3376 / VPI C15-48 / C15-B4) TaxID=515620 RepID=C4Z4H3_LACE2|nr:Hypothetical protein EUBELI_00644 [[Eubacterium] eligens ATCC 27750]
MPVTPKCAAHGYLIILLIYVFSASVCAGLTLDKYESDNFVLEDRYGYTN